MLLLIGYGNPLRRDDGVGPLVAERVAAARSDVSLISVHQLLPEHAEPISRARRVVFVDATAVSASGTISTLPLAPDPAADLGRLHDFSPQSLLTYAALLYDGEPSAALVTVGGYDFGGGEGLSAALAERLAEVETAVLAALDQTAG